MNKEFIELLKSNENHVEDFEGSFDSVQDGQNPDVVTVCCSDSRVLQDHIWDNEEPGNVFTVSNIGNRVYQEAESGERFVSGDMIYPVTHTGTDTMVVIGHTGCGAVTATYQSIEGDLDYESEPRGIQRCVDLLEPHIEEGVEELPEGLGEEEAINYLVEYNVDRQVELLRNSEDVPEDVDVVGAVYDLHNVYSGDYGHVHIVNVNGENGVENLRDDYSAVDDRFERLWQP